MVPGSWLFGCFWVLGLGESSFVHAFALHDMFCKTNRKLYISIYARVDHCNVTALSSNCLLYAWWSKLTFCTCRYFVASLLLHRAEYRELGEASTINEKLEACCDSKHELVCEAHIVKRGLYLFRYVNPAHISAQK